MLTLIEIPISPYAQKVKLALLEKGLSFEVERIDMERYPDSMESLGIRREVPVLVDGDLRLADSTIIVAYLEETHPAPALLPPEPRERARVRAIERLCDTTYDAVVWGVNELMYFRRGDDALRTSMLARARAQVVALNAQLEAELTTRPWLTGEQLGLADIAAYPYVNGAASQGNKPEPGSRLEAWLTAMRARPSAERVRQDIRDSMAAFANVPKRIAGGTAKRQYRDHRLEWVLRSGGLTIVASGLEADDLFFSTAP